MKKVQTVLVSSNFSNLLVLVSFIKCNCQIVTCVSIIIIIIIITFSCLFLTSSLVYVAISLNSASDQDARAEISRELALRKFVIDIYKITFIKDLVIYCLSTVK